MLITDIGISSPLQLMCITDESTCCISPNMTGYWLFPNGEIVSMSNQNLTSFRADRSADGDISLYRVHRNVTAPTGQFCCRVTDATATNRNLCVNIGKSTHAAILHNSWCYNSMSFVITWFSILSFSSY